MSSRTHREWGSRSHVTDEALVKRRCTQIVTAAVELFSEKGYYRTTVQEVAQRAGVSAGLIYQYVENKEDLLLLSILDVLDSYRTEIPAAMEGLETALERYCAAFRAYCRVVDVRHKGTVLAYRSSRSLSPEGRQKVKEAERETNEMIEACIRDCIEEGVFRPVTEALVTYELVMYAHAWALKRWYFANDFDLESFVEQGLDHFLHAFLTEKGWQQRAEQAANISEAGTRNRAPAVS